MLRNFLRQVLSGAQYYYRWILKKAYSYKGIKLILFHTEFLKGSEMFVSCLRNVVTTCGEANLSRAVIFVTSTQK